MDNRNSWIIRSPTEIVHIILQCLSALLNSNIGYQKKITWSISRIKQEVPALRKKLFPVPSHRAKDLDFQNPPRTQNSMYTIPNSQNWSNCPKCWKQAGRHPDQPDCHYTVDALMITLDPWSKMESTRNLEKILGQFLFPILNGQFRRDAIVRQQVLFVWNAKRVGIHTFLCNTKGQVKFCRVNFVLALSWQCLHCIQREIFSDTEHKRWKQISQCFPKISVENVYVWYFPQTSKSIFPNTGASSVLVNGSCVRCLKSWIINLPTMSRNIEGNLQIFLDKVDSNLPNEWSRCQKHKRTRFWPLYTFLAVVVSKRTTISSGVWVTKHTDHFDRTTGNFHQKRREAKDESAVKWTWHLYLLNVNLAT